MSLAVHDSNIFSSGSYRLFRPLFLFLLLCLGIVGLCRLTLGVAGLVRVLLGELLAPAPFQPGNQNGLAVLKVRLLLRREHVPVNLCRNPGYLLFVEAVRCAGILRIPRRHVQTDERGELLPLPVDHVFEEDRAAFAERFAVFRCQRCLADFLRNVDFPGFGIAARVVGLSGHAVERDECREQLAVGALHVLHEDGVPLAEHLELVG